MFHSTHWLLIYFICWLYPSYLSLSSTDTHSMSQCHRSLKHKNIFYVWMHSLTLVERLSLHKLLPCTEHCSVPLSPCLLNKKFHHLHNTHHKTLTQGWWLPLYEAGHVSESYISHCAIVSHHRILAGGRKSELMQPATHYPVITTAKGE